MVKSVRLLLCTIILLNAELRAGNTPVLAFKENKHQWAAPVVFKTELQNGAVFLCKDNFTFVMLDTADMNRLRHGHHPWGYKPDYDLTVRGHSFREIFKNARADCKVDGSNKLDEYFNYYIGNDHSQWAPHVNAFYNIAYHNLYDNIDVRVSSKGVNMEYDFIVKKGGNVSDILIGYEGIDGMLVKNGALVLQTSIGDFVDSKPFAYQMINGEKHEVECRYVLIGNEISFAFPNGYDKDQELVIDPVLIFSTYSGSTADNFGYSATFDSRGNAYAAGSVFQVGQYPVTVGAFQTSWAGGVGFGLRNNYDGTGTDVAVTKYDSAGQHRIYSTYLGGNHDELPHSLIVNSNDELFILGTTASDNFPVTANAFDTTFKGGPPLPVFYGIGVHYSTGSDMFITRFNSTGTALLGSTYVGGTDDDGLTYPEYQGLNYNYADEVRGEIAVDKNDNVYVASCSRSTDFPTTAGAYQTTKHNLSDGVVFKMTDDLSTMVWSTFLGGNEPDALYSLDFDPNGDLYVAGGTQSSDLVDTTSHVIQTHYGGGRADGFIAHLSKNGNVLYQSTYYGSKEYDQIYFVRTDKLGNVYVFGQTDDTSGLFIKNALYNRPKSGQFISKIKPKLDTVIWSTAFGSGRGQPDISPTAFSVDVCNKTYISGWGSDFHRLYGINGAPALSTAGLDITANAFQTNNDSCDFYVMVMADDASSLAYATFMGSPTDEQHVDGGTSRFDRKGVIYQSVCAGCGGQSNFPTTLGAVSDSNWSPNCNNAVFKFDLQLPIVVSDFYGPNIGCAPFTVTFTNSSKIVLSPGYTWNFGDGGTSTASNPTHTYTQPGTYTIQLVVTDPASCNGSDTFTQQILIHAPGANDTIPPVIACYGQKVQIGIAPGNDTSYRYMWSPSATLNQSNISNPVANTLQSMTYHMLMWDGLCTDTFLQQVNIFNDSLHLLASSLLCAGDTLRLYASNSVPGQAQVYRWTPVDEIISGVNSSSPLVQPLQNTLFKVTLVDSNGCSFSDSIQISITSSLPSVRAVANPDSILYGDSSQLSLTLSANVVTYLWQNDSTLSATNILNPFADPRETRTYYVQVSDSYDCKKYDTVTVYVYHTPCSETSLYIPDAFTPNGDGKNDMLYVRGNGLSNLYFAVYDRWGQKVFETRDITVGWDGTYKGKKMDDSVFGYYAEGVCDNGEKFKKRGNVTLLK